MTSKTESEMESIDCPLCGSGEGGILFEGPDRMFPGREIFTNRICGQCGLIYLSPRPKDMREFYPPEYGAYLNKKSRVVSFLKGLSLRKDFSSYRPFLGSDSKILEVGCATGETLHFFKQMGFQQVTGVEWNPFAAEIGRKRYGLTIHSGDFLSMDFAEGTFDFILMRYVLEHVPNPVEVAAKVNFLLKRGGTFVFLIPNPDALSARVFGRQWYNYDLPRHLVEFPAKALETIAVKTGFKPMKIEHIAVPNDWINSTGYWLEDKGASWARKIFTFKNILLLPIFYPLALMESVLERSGRIRVFFRKD